MKSIGVAWTKYAKPVLAGEMQHSRMTFGRKSKTLSTIGSAVNLSNNRKEGIFLCIPYAFLELNRKP